MRNHESSREVPPPSRGGARLFSACRILSASLVLGGLATSALAGELVVIDLQRVDASSIQVNSARVSRQDGGLAINGTEPPACASVLFPLPKALQDLSAKHYLEVDIENKTEKALRFTFWALSGSGWGGVSTWSTKKYEIAEPGHPKPLGYETLAPRQRQKFKIDLHARYPGPDARCKAINPASVRWLKIVMGDGKSVPSVVLHKVLAAGEGPAEPHDISKRVLVPDIEKGPPAAGRRIYQQLPGWEATKVRHVLALPREWRRGGKYPIIVEYTGNVFYDKFCHSTGYTEQGNMAYGLSRGEKYICLNLPFISEDGQREQENAWGSPEKTIDYCLQALRLACDRYGGDSNAVFFTGFSRGSIAANYIALRDERIAAVWLGFVGVNPGTTWTPAMGAGWNKCGTGWNERAARLNGRPCIVAHPNYGYGVHVDVEYLEDSASTIRTRQWMTDLLQTAAHK